MAQVAARAGHEVVLYARDKKQVEDINLLHKNVKMLGKLGDFELLPNIRATTDLAEAVSGVTVIIHSIPAQLTPRFLAENKDIIPPTACIVITSKGLYVPTEQLMYDAVLDAMGREQPLAILSGPSFAREMMSDFPTAVTVACHDPEWASYIQHVISSGTFRVYTTTDVLGVQLGGALKNPLAIGAGMLEGLGFGSNTLAGFLTRGCSEMRKLSVAMGGKAETLNGLSGVGDLMLTAYGALSRNRQVGTRLAKGESLADICREMTCEGVPTASVAIKLAEEYQLNLPNFRMIAAILAGKVTLEQARHVIMSQPLHAED
jgi:glycerol-3-phosphate dehydrogenase (NAD+)